MMALLFFLSVIGIQVVEVMALVATLLYLVGGIVARQDRATTRREDWNLEDHISRVPV